MCITKAELRYLIDEADRSILDLENQLDSLWDDEVDERLEAQELLEDYTSLIEYLDDQYDNGKTVDVKYLKDNWLNLSTWVEETIKDYGTKTDTISDWKDENMEDYNG